MATKKTIKKTKQKKETKKISEADTGNGTIPTLDDQDNPAMFSKKEKRERLKSKGVKVSNTMSDDALDARIEQYNLLNPEQETQVQETEETSTPQENVSSNEEKIDIEQPEPSKAEEAVPAKVEVGENVMTKKNWIEKQEVKVQPILNEHDGKIQVKCTGNNGSFVLGQEYRVSPRVLETYAGILEVIE